MAEMSNYLENALINATLRNTSYTSPTTTYLALYTTDPTDADTGTEVSGGSYARQAITFGSASGGSESSTNSQTFNGMPAETTGVPYIGVWSAATSGTYICGGTNTGTSASANIPAGAIVTFAIAGVTATIS